MLLVKNYIECYLNSLRALAKITSESFSYEVCNHAETLEEEEAHEKSYFSTLNSNVHSPSNNNTGNSYFQGYKCKMHDSGSS